VLTVLACVVSLIVGGVLGWKLTAKRERLTGYAQAVDDQFKRLRSAQDAWRFSSSLRILKGGKK